MKKILFLALLYSLSNADNTININSCKGCHGADFSKKALNKSKVVKDMTNQEIFNALQGYKNGTYGGPLSSIMKGQIIKYNNIELQVIANKIVPPILVKNTDINTTDINNSK